MGRSVTRPFGADPVFVYIPFCLLSLAYSVRRASSAYLRIFDGCLMYKRRTAMTYRQNAKNPFHTLFKQLGAPQKFGQKGKKNISKGQIILKLIILNQKINYFLGLRPELLEKRLCAQPCHCFC